MLRKKSENLPFSDEDLEKFLNSLDWKNKEIRGRREYTYANRVEVSNKSVVLGLLLERGVRFTIGNFRYLVEVGRISKYDQTKLVEPEKSIMNKFLQRRKL